jgi:hypothetical protein
MNDQQIVVPDWVPPVLHNFALWLRQGTIDETSLRLLTDLRMKNVWRRLLNHKHLSELVVDALKPSGVVESFENSHAVNLQEKAALKLYFNAWVRTMIPNQTWVIWKSDVLKKAGEYEFAADVCLREGFGPLPIETKFTLLAAEKHLRAKAEAVRHDNNPYILDKSSGDRNNDDLRGHSRSIGTFLKITYGQVMYGTLATIVNVAFMPNPEIDEKKARLFCRILPGEIEAS